MMSGSDFAKEQIVETLGGNPKDWKRRSKKMVPISSIVSSRM